MLDNDMIKGISIGERDIDLLIAEEFATSPVFAKQFLLALKDVKNAKELPILESATVSVLRIERSTYKSNREIDLIVHVSISGEEWRIYIENKIDAAFQKGQVDEYVELNRHDRKISVLFCPKEYEKRSEWMKKGLPCLEHDTIYDKLPDFKKELLKKAKANDDPATTNFWEAYAAFCQSKFSELKMKPPKVYGRGGKSCFFHFYPDKLGDQLPSGIPVPQLKHKAYLAKISRGSVDLEFSSRKTNLIEFASMINKTYGGYLRNLPFTADIQPIGSSVAIRVKVPIIRVGLNFEESKIREILETVKALYLWWLETNTALINQQTGKIHASSMPTRKN